MKNTRSHEPKKTYRTIMCTAAQHTDQHTNLHTYIHYIYQKQTSQININGQTVKNQI